MLVNNIRCFIKIRDTIEELHTIFLIIYGMLVNPIHGSLQFTPSKQTLMSNFKHDRDHNPNAYDEEQEGNIIGQARIACQFKSTGTGE